MWKPAAARTLTGTNDVPLGNRRRFGPTVIEDAPRPELAPVSASSFPKPPPSGDRKDDPSPPQPPRKYT